LIDPDRSRLERMTRGDASALAELYDAHAGAVYSLARRIVSVPEDAEDVTHDVFAQAWKTATHYDAVRGAVAAWLLMITRSRAIDLLRRRRSSGDGGKDVAAIPDPGPDVEYIAANEEQVAATRDAIQQLPDEQRRTLELAYYEGLTHMEIAARTSTPLGTVKTRIRSAFDVAAPRPRHAGRSRGRRSMIDDDPVDPRVLAVTVEPTGGVPAPTGPQYLLGAPTN
jgi:RNA polymerase sigma-70 factor (ECF subfamily)